MNVLRIIAMLFLVALTVMEFAVARHKHVTTGTCDEHLLTACGFMIFTALMGTVLY